MRAVSFLLALVVASGSIQAQQQPRVELGTTLGATISIPDGGDAEVFIGAPAGGTLFGLPSFYLTVFPSPAFMLEPQVYFAYSSATESAVFSGIVQLGYLLNAAAPGSGYLAVHGGVFATEGLNSGAVGAGIGYRRLVRDVLTVRMEARYRRWLCDFCDLNDVAALLGIGVMLK